MKVQINTVGGDIRSIDLLKYTDYDDTSKPYQFLMSNNNRILWHKLG